MREHISYRMMQLICGHIQEACLVLLLFFCEKIEIYVGIILFHVRGMLRNVRIKKELCFLTSLLVLFCQEYMFTASLLGIC